MTAAGKILRASLAAVLLMLPAAGAGAQTDQPAVSIVLYESGFTVVEERRIATLPRGASAHAIDDLPEGFRPDTAVVAFTDTDAVTLRGTRYMTPAGSLLEAFVGERVHVIQVNPATGEERVRDARLLRASPGPLVEIDGRIELSVPGRIALPRVPPGAVLAPTLLVDVEAKRAGPTPYRLSYITEGPGWSADYVLRLDPTERWAVLQGRATLRNPGMRTFRDAAVRLVAGSVHRVAGGPQPFQAKAGLRVMASESMAAADAPVPVSELQVYDLPRPLDLIAGAQEKAILFDAVRIGVEKTYRLVSHASPHPRSGGESKGHPAARLSFTNDKANGLGIPLPRGIARMYGSGLLLGEDRIPHTPRGERVTLAMAQAVEITVRRKRTDYRADGLPKGTAEVAYEIALSNAKSKQVTVEIVEAMTGEWRILSSTLAHARESDQRAVWQVEVPAEGETILQYRARIKFR